MLHAVEIDHVHQQFKLEPVGQLGLEAEDFLRVENQPVFRDRRGQPGEHGGVAQRLSGARFIVGDDFPVADFAGDGAGGGGAAGGLAGALGQGAARGDPGQSHPCREGEPVAADLRPVPGKPLLHVARPAAGRGQVVVGQEQAEFVVAAAPQDRVLGQVGRQHGGNPGQRHVAQVIAHGQVDQPELIQVDHAQAAGSPLPQAGKERRAEPRAVTQTRQPVRAGIGTRDIFRRGSLPGRLRARSSFAQLLHPATLPASFARPKGHVSLQARVNR